MNFSLPWPTGTPFWLRWSWHQWLAGLLLILLGCLNLIWPLPTLMLSVALILLVLFLIRPYLVLLTIIFLIGFECIGIEYTFLPRIDALGTTPFYLMSVLGLLCWGMARAAGLTEPYQSTSLDLPLFIFWLTGLVALLWTSSWIDGITLVVFHTMSYCLYLLISALNTTPPKVERLFWLLFGLGNLTILTTFATFFFGYKELIHLTDNITLSITIFKFDGTRGSLSGTMRVAKAISGIFNVSIFCGLGLLYTRTSTRARLLIFLSVLVMVFLHTLTLSRAETMGLIVGWLAFVHLNEEWRYARVRQYLYMLVTALGIVLVLIAMLGIFYHLEEFMARSAGQEYTVGGYRFSAAQARVDHMLYALRTIWETGGLGAGAAGIMRGMDPTVSTQSPSLYFSFLTEHGYGLLSLILMGWIIANLIIELRWALHNCPDPRLKIFIISICAALVVYATAGTLDHIYYNYEMWLLLGFAVAAVKAVRYLLKSSPPITEVCLKPPPVT
jgi:hypothetical protein